MAIGSIRDSHFKSAVLKRDEAEQIRLNDARIRTKSPFNSLLVMLIYYIWAARFSTPFHVDGTGASTIIGSFFTG